MKKLISALLAFAMVFGTVALVLPMASVTAYAAESTGTEGKLSYEIATDKALTISYESLKDKLEKDTDLKLRLTLKVGGVDYRLYCNEYTGEVIYQNMATGEGLTTNPYNAGGNDKISDAIKEELLSQIVISYKGKDGTTQKMFSFKEAAQRGQIQVRNIKNGIRVMYTMGRENSTYLLPGWITEQSFQEKIVAPFQAYLDRVAEEYAEEGGVNSKEYQALLIPFKALTEGAYTKIDLTEFSNKLQTSVKLRFPIVGKIDPTTGKNYVIYAIDEQLSDASKNRFESYIKTYCPEYGYDDLMADHAVTEYVSTETTPPLFKLSLEYTINPTDGSLNVRLPANGIRYDETLFELDYISPLNYLGAGYMSEETFGNYSFTDGVYGGETPNAPLYDGYAFYPDGSGALFEFTDLYSSTVKQQGTWTGKVYGQDFAYYKVTGQNQESIRVPVYGVTGTVGVVPDQLFEKNPDGSYVPGDVDGKKPLTNEAGFNQYDLIVQKGGYLAIMEEGDALTNLTFSAGATKHNYASVYATYYPRPKDTYDLSDMVSVSGNTEWTVVSDRKYTGSYRTKILLLSDTAIGDFAVSQQKIASYYPATWVGMATAYRDYLEANGSITRLTEADVSKDMPLYIETFGAIETTKQILSVPVQVKVPLTSFEDVDTMYEALKTMGITNVNFKLTGFANGGMESTYPTKLSFEKSVGGASGFEKLVEKANEKGYGVFPDFDFVYINNQESFDGVSLKDAGARTVDNRYCSKQLYDAVYQEFFSYFNLCVATNIMGQYYDKFITKLSRFTEDYRFGISVGTLGSDLNSNFDEDNPINREEAKQDVSALFDKIQKNEGFSSIMTAGGNMYAVKYADHILDLPLGSSNYRYQSASVPFTAMVLHGYVNYAGGAINMFGDTEYNMLKSIENGAALYYKLSSNTENTMLMKQDTELSKYYSIRFDIWDDTVKEQYNKLNAALGDLQTSLIVDHSFIIGERVLTESESKQNKDLLAATIYAAVDTAITNSNKALISTLRERLDLYEMIRLHDATLKASPNKMMLTVNVDLLFKSVSPETRTTIVNAYYDEATNTIRQDGMQSLGVKLGLSVNTNVNVNRLWASAVEATQGLYTAEELVALKAGVYAVIVDRLAVMPGGLTVRQVVDAILDRKNNRKLSDEASAAIYAMILDGVPAGKTAYEVVEAAVNSDETLDFYDIADATKINAILAAIDGCFVDVLSRLSAVFSREVTQADVAWFNRMVYSTVEVDEAYLTEQLKAQYGADYTNPYMGTLLALINECRANKTVWSLADAIEVEFDFNRTNSSAIEGERYDSTDYTLKDERLVLVTYSNATKDQAETLRVQFILNYNIFSVKVRMPNGQVYEIAPYDFVRVDLVNTTTGGEG